MRLTARVQGLTTDALTGKGQLELIIGGVMVQVVCPIDDALAMRPYLYETVEVAIAEEGEYAVLAEDWRRTCAKSVKERDAAWADLAAVHDALADVPHGRLPLPLAGRVKALAEAYLHERGHVLAEREACAVVCDNQAHGFESAGSTTNEKKAIGARKCAARIRAGGRKPDAEVGT